jgi:NAD(P)-dependent dehydrogenase (short-subunit alcohol dehydrogenase family)
MNTRAYFSKIFKVVGTRLARKVMTATRVVESADPTKWREHLYGLTQERWESLEGKRFWITGAGTGYGRCLACALAAAGAQVFLTGRRLEKLQESIEEIESMGIPTGNCLAIPADISNPESILQACERVRNLSEALNGLVNNAAVPSRGHAGISTPLQVEPLEFWEQMMRVNVTAPWLLTRTIFPHMRNSGHVRVLFISSEAGWASTAGVGIYNISKAAINSLAHSMAEEYAHSFPKEDIQMNVLVPGEARTEMNKGSTVSPYAVVSMALILLSYPEGGPNGRFFARDGRHLSFGYTEPYDKPLI